MAKLTFPGASLSLRRGMIVTAADIRPMFLIGVRGDTATFHYLRWYHRYAKYWWALMDMSA